MTSMFSKSRIDLVVLALRDSEAPLTVKDIAAVTKLAEVSVRRHLRTLRDTGMAVRVPRSRSVLDSPRGRTPDRFQTFGS
jgi:predicted ArsR family transcriptional regulator